jgi:hypothetical protein
MPKTAVKKQDKVSEQLCRIYAKASQDNFDRWQKSLLFRK